MTFADLVSSNATWSFASPLNFCFYDEDDNFRVSTVSDIFEKYGNCKVFLFGGYYVILEKV